MTCAIPGGNAFAQSQANTAPHISALPVSDGIHVSNDIPVSNDIIVTGSRIGNIAISAQPIVNITGADLSDMGATNVGQALSSLPEFGVPGNSTIGNQGSFSAGQTFVNLYDLGAQRTLTLVNGSRFVSSATSSIFGPVQGAPVDLGQIAPGLVDHIDVVSVGGAPIYGSDAIAGTVNVILKKNYQGVQLDASTGISALGDAQDYNFALLAGRNFAEGRGNITLDLYTDHQDGLTNAARASTNGSEPFFGQSATGTGQGYTLFNGGQRLSLFTNTGIPLAINTLPILSGRPFGAVRNAVGQAVTFNGAGQLVPYISGTPQLGGISEAGGSGFNASPYGNLLTDSNRLQGTLLGHYDVSDHLHLHGEAWLNRDSATNLAGQTYYNSAALGATGTPNGDLALSTSNPFLSAADAATIQHRLRPGTSTFYLSRANTDLESGAFQSSTDLYRLVGGVDGDFTSGSHHFVWEANLNYGHISTATTTRELDTQNFFNAVGMVTATDRGGAPCAGGNSPAQTISATCAPLDIFGLGNESQAAINYVTALAQTRQTDTQLDFVADLKGDLAQLPGGEAKFVAGYEHRRESQNFDPGAFYRGQLQANDTYTQYGQGLPISPVSGAYHTDEGFAELNLPVIRHLDLQSAARFTQNSMTGGFWSYSGGGSYAPVTGITLRGNITRAFRAPSVTELFSPRSSVNEAGYDPCDAAFITGGPNPATRAANCAAAGITQPFTSVLNSTSVSGVGGGNTHLQNERTHSWTAGIAITPKAVTGLGVTADYININIANEITAPGLTSLLDACYDAANYPSNAYCGSFTRNTAGQVTNFTDAYINIADELFRAAQATLTYHLPLDMAGMLNLKLNYLHTFQHNQQIATGLPEQLVGNPANPRDNVTGSVDWARQAFDWRWDVTYFGPTQVALNVAPGTYTPGTVPPYWMFDSSIGIRTSGHIAFRMVVDNVFNRAIGSPYAFDPNRQFEAILGRSFKLNGQVKF